MLRFTTVTIATLLAGCTACSESPPLVDPCDQALTTTFEPQPTGTEPMWVEPAWTFERPPETWVFTNTWLPWNYNRASFYPIEEGDSVYFRFRFMTGVDFENAESATALVYVEGRPSPVIFNGERVPRITVPLVGGLAETSVVSIPPDLLAPGLNQVNVVMIYRLNGRHGPTIFHEGAVFTVANGSLEPQEYIDTPGLEPVEFAGTEPSRVYRLASEYPELGELDFGYLNRNVRGWDDPLDVIVRLRASSPWATSCPDAEERIAVVAILDEEPTSMGDLPSIFASVRPGYERVHRFQLPFWSDGEGHLWGILAFTGFGRPARQHHGGVASWISGRSLLSFVQWAPD